MASHFRHPASRARFRHRPAFLAVPAPRHGLRFAAQPTGMAPARRESSGARALEARTVADRADLGEDM